LVALHSRAAAAAAALLLKFGTCLQADGYFYVDLIEKRGEGVVF
jgi:hypothetical protein